MRRLFLVSFLLFLFASGFLGISALMSGTFDQGTGRILVTTGAASFYSLVALAALSLFGRSTEIVGKAGLVFCGIAFAHALYTTWTPVDGLGFLQHRIAFALLGIAVIHTCLMLLINARGIIVTGLVVGAIGAGAAACLITVASIYALSAGAWLIITVLGIISVCCTIGAPVANMAYK
ncbi:MAG: hypothetical protein AAFY99_00555 [Pseudomonadota bacterium]